MIHFDFTALRKAPIAVSCPTEEDAELLFDFLRNETDVLWATKTPLSATFWNMHKSRTHYDFGSNVRGLQYGSGGWGREHGSQFMSVHEFLAMYRDDQDVECVDLTGLL